MKNENRIYIFTYGKEVVWTSSEKERNEMLESSYTYKGYIDPDTKTSGGSNLMPYNGK